MKLGNKLALIIYALAILMSWLIFPGGARSTIWYCSKGGDNSTGRDWAHGFTDIDTIENHIAIGDTVLFGSGIWLKSQLNAAAGSFASPTVYGCSTLSSASFNLATISAGESVTNWIAHSGYIYKAYWHRSSNIAYGSDNYNTNKAYSLVCNDTTLYPQFELSGVDAPGQFYQNPSNDTVYAWFWGNASPFGKEILIAGGPSVIVASGRDHIKFIGLNFKMGKQAVVEVGNGCDSLFFIHCDFQHNANRRVGGEANNPSLLGFMEHDLPNRYIYIIGCNFSDVYGDDFPSSSIIGNDHSGSGIKFYRAEHCIIDSCTFRRCGAHGIKFKSAYSELSQWNTVKHCIFYGDYQNESTWENQKSMLDGGIMFVLHCGNDSAYDNIIIQAREGIRLGQMGASAENLYDQVGNNYIYNNTIINCGYFMAFDGNRLLSKQHIKYNVGYNFVVRDFTFDEQPESYNNLHDSTMADSNYWYDTSDFSARYNDSYHTWSEWQSIGKDLHSYATVNPGFDSLSALNPLLGLKRSASSTEMSLAYGGKMHYQWGAIQNLDTIIVPHDTSFTISGTITLNGSGLANVAILGTTTNEIGAYSVSRDSAWSGTAIPVLSGYTFTPSSRNYPSLSSDQNNQDYTATFNNSSGRRGPRFRR